jgi:hypothetical protein
MCKTGGGLGNVLRELGKHHGGATNPVFLLYRFCLYRLCLYGFSFSHLYYRALDQRRLHFIQQMQSRCYERCRRPRVVCLLLQQRGCCLARDFCALELCPARFTVQARSGLADDERRVGPFAQEHQCSKPGTRMPQPRTEDLVLRADSRRTVVGCSSGRASLFRGVRDVLLACSA